MCFPFLRTTAEYKQRRNTTIKIHRIKSTDKRSLEVIQLNVSGDQYSNSVTVTNCGPNCPDECLKFPQFGGIPRGSWLATPVIHVQVCVCGSEHRSRSKNRGVVKKRSIETRCIGNERATLAVLAQRCVKRWQAADNATRTRSPNYRMAFGRPFLFSLRRQRYGFSIFVSILRQFGVSPLDNPSRLMSVFDSLVTVTFANGRRFGHRIKRQLKSATSATGSTSLCYSTEDTNRI